MPLRLSAAIQRVQALGISHMHFQQFPDSCSQLTVVLQFVIVRYQVVYDFGLFFRKVKDFTS
jgi:hypothetical protein